MTEEGIRAIYDCGVDAVIEVIRSLEARIQQLEGRIKHLEAIISKDSHNSSKPPSTDINRKPKNTSLRESSGRSAGGQEGHPGTTLKQVTNPDEIIIYKVEQCKHCGYNLKNHEAESKEKRQVFDIPPIKIEVTEHQNETKTCPVCGTMNQSQFPENVKQAAQYGNRLKGIDKLSKHLSIDTIWSVKRTYSRYIFPFNKRRYPL